jgi:hypothetical protein
MQGPQLLLLDSLLHYMSMIVIDSLLCVFHGLSSKEHNQMHAAHSFPAHPFTCSAVYTGTILDHATNVTVSSATVPLGVQLTDQRPCVVAAVTLWPKSFTANCKHITDTRY